MHRAAASSCIHDGARNKSQEKTPSIGIDHFHIEVAQMCSPVSGQCKPQSVSTEGGVGVRNVPVQETKEIMELC